MKTMEELQAEVLKLEVQFQVLETAAITVDGLTVGDIISLSKELASLKKELNELKDSQTPSFVPYAPPNAAPPPPGTPPFVSYGCPNTAPPPPRPRKWPVTPSLPMRCFTEGNIGRYVIGILASLLILLAVGLAAGAFWEYIPDGIKFSFFLAAGVVSEGFGWKRLQKTGIRNGFWTSLTGLGAALSFVSVVLGEAVWGLYPTIVTGIALIA